MGTPIETMWDGAVSKDTRLVKKVKKKQVPAVKKAKKPIKPAVKKTAVGAKAGSVARKPVARKGFVPAPTSHPVSKISKKEAAEFRQLLIRLRERIRGQINALKGDSLTRQDEVNTEEDGSDAFERQLALTLVSSENDSLFEIDEAIQRIGEGTYGICTECNKVIERLRLKALPFVRMCVACQSVNEKGRIKMRPRSEVVEV